MNDTSGLGKDSVAVVSQVGPVSRESGELITNKRQIETTVLVNDGQIIVLGESEDEYLPILVLTADATAVTKQRALSGGARDFLTKPFQFEGQRRMRTAESGIAELHKVVDTLLIIPNQNLFRVANEKTTFADAFAMADQVLYSGVACITDLMVKEGLINLDFADVRAVMRGMGKAMMGTGEASGEDRARHAAEAAIANPLLQVADLRALLRVAVGRQPPQLALVDLQQEDRGRLDRARRPLPLDLQLRIRPGEGFSAGRPRRRVLQRADREPAARCEHGGPRRFVGLPPRRDCQASAGRRQGRRCGPARQPRASPF